ncbi:adenylosuccinate synthase [Candidatus Bipolaricaulota bacterium]|nr:adenylosuccinate synthase [Candidatus Bipolaricaulota bacterium]
MSATAILGMQWGDEGKGKITHLLARKADIIVRFNGGPNAGHTVIDRGREFKFHLIPAGALYPEKTNILAGGVVLDIEVLQREIDAVTKHSSVPQIYIADTAHLILPYHRILEQIEGSAAKIGTTKRGIGPTYRDKIDRTGIRAGDLKRPAILQEKLTAKIDFLKSIWPAVEEIQSLNVDLLFAQLQQAAALLIPLITNIPTMIRQGINSGKEILFEGAQGALLDIDCGTYPYVTSSSTTLAGVIAGGTVPPSALNRRLGVIKAYTTRVGNGPFPTELTDHLGKMMQTKGGEFGATTGRPRRCGWLDLVALTHIVYLNDLSDFALTKLDILSGFEKLKVAYAYRLAGEEIDYFPTSAEELAICEPLYKEVEGWEEEIAGIERLSALPTAARHYIDMITEALGVPLSLISTGPRPEDTIIIS